MNRLLGTAILCLAMAVSALAHVGSPDVFFEGMAGEYRMLVVVRMPRVIPGVAQIEVRTLSPGVRSIRVAPAMIRGPGSDLQPVADRAVRDRTNQDIYRAELWLMLRGAWKVGVVAEGDRGEGTLSVPVGAVSSATLPMQRMLRWILGPLALLLVVGAIAIVGASVREGTSWPGTRPAAATVRRARIAMLCAAAIITILVWAGNRWWQAAATDAERIVYETPGIDARLMGDRTLSVTAVTQGSNLALQRAASLDDAIPDHGHLMHLFLVRQPGMDFLAHLHPTPDGRGAFVEELPSMPEGRYRVFADVVHATGFPETAIGEIALPQIISGLPEGDDSLAPAPNLLTGPQDVGWRLSRGAQMIWVNGLERFRAGDPVWLTFRVEDATGQLVSDLEPYMGMAGHLVMVRADWQVFAHLHPAGSAPMASVELANGSPTSAHAGHAPSAEISFPYGFPQPGHYRLFVQIKREGRVETGVFDALVN